jgi:hypothetical protein
MDVPDSQMNIRSDRRAFPSLLSFGKKTWTATQAVAGE